MSETSAKEIGTSRASMNRTGKTQGVKKHYNEYKDFLQQEIEAHICVSFMEMLDMNTSTGYSMSWALRRQERSLAKLFFCKICLQKLGWGEQVPVDIKRRWNL